MLNITPQQLTVIGRIVLAIFACGVLAFWFFNWLSKQEKLEVDKRKREQDGLRPTGAPPELEMGADEKPIYQKKRYFFTYQERRFFETLENVVGERFQIFAKVRMADIMWIANEPYNKRTYNNHLRCRHLDFLLCDPNKKQPLLAIELDDSSHENYYRKESDEFKTTACKSAGLHLIRFEVSQRYSEQEILNAIQNKLEVS